MIKGIAVFDLHYPHQNKTLWDNILKFTKDFKPDVFVLGGDNLNMDAVDHWKMEKGQKRPLEGRRLKKEYAGFTKDILDPLEKILGENTRKIWMYGNHEEWVDRYIDKHPEAEGILELENFIDLEDWETYPYGITAKVGKLYFHHGQYVNKYSAAKTMEVYGRNIVYGHGHTHQTYTKITPIDSEAHSATQAPCACNMNPDYMKNGPSAWVNGFVVFYIQPNGNFNLYPVVAPKGKFTAPSGKQY